MGIQTGIDGYRVVADRTGLLAGISDPTHTEADGAKYPLTASVTVKKLLPNGSIADFTATARWSEYNAGGPMWTKMPYLMLGKCAEALALRKAFPADLSGIYTSEEMAQADNPQQEQTVRAEIQRQKGEPGTMPPELDWMYKPSNGLLICRILSAVSRKKKKGDGDYLTIKINNSIEGKDVATYFHAGSRDAILAAVGKVCKFVVSMSADGKFVNVDDVLEVDGKPGEKTNQSETKAQSLATELGFEGEELNELFTRYCNGSWDDVVEKLEERKRNLGDAPEVEEKQ
jgi:hypothetical protein